jgi:hypothetical protein
MEGESLETLGLAILAAVVGAAFCFFGYRFFLLLLPLWGFVAGFLAGMQGMQVLLGESFFASTVGIVVGLVLGVILAVLAYLFYYAAIVILGAAVGYTLGYGLMSAIGLDGIVGWGAGIAVGAIFAVGVVVLNAPKAVLIVLSAAGGAALLIAGGMLLFNVIEPGDLGEGVLASAIMTHTIWLIAWAVAAVAGAFVQFTSTQGHELERETYRYS